MEDKKNKTRIAYQTLKKNQTQILIKQQNFDKEKPLINITILEYI